MHATLQRQIQKYIGDNTLNMNDPALVGLLDAISKTYEGYDENRKMIEHALELSTTELNQKNQKLEEELKKSQQQRDEFEKINRFMTGREIKMIELKKEIEILRTKLGEQKVNTPINAGAPSQNQPLNS